MLFLPVSLALFILLLVLIPALFVLAPAVAFAKLGLDPWMGYLFFLLCLLGGSINIPLYRERVSVYSENDELSLFLREHFGLRIPRLNERVIAINLGGAVLPGLLSLYLLSLAPLGEVLMATAFMVLAAYGLSKPVRGIGIVLPTFVPPIIAAIVAVIIAREHAPQVAYVSGVMGTLIGADVLRLPQIKRMGSSFMSIGGAGVFDGIYLVGLVSVLLA